MNTTTATPSKNREGVPAHPTVGVGGHHRASGLATKASKKVPKETSAKSFDATLKPKVYRNREPSSAPPRAAPGSERTGWTPRSLPDPEPPEDLPWTVSVCAGPVPGTVPRADAVGGVQEVGPPVTPGTGAPPPTSVSRSPSRPCPPPHSGPRPGRRRTLQGETGGWAVGSGPLPSAPRLTSLTPCCRASRCTP